MLKKHCAAPYKRCGAAYKKSHLFTGRNFYVRKDLSDEKMISSARSKFFFQKFGASALNFWKKKAKSHKKKATVTT